MLSSIWPKRVGNRPNVDILGNANRVFMDSFVWYQLWLGQIVEYRLRIMQAPQLAQAFPATRRIAAR